MTATTVSTPDAQVTATPASTRGVASHADPGFGAALRSEWTKLRSLRATWIIVSLAIGLSVGFSVLIAFVTGLTYDSWSVDVQAAFDPVLTTTSGWLFGIVLLTVLGVTAVTSEYSSGMIRTTFISNPRRLRVFAAKATVLAALGVAISTISSLGMFLLSQPIYHYYELETASITDNDAIRLLMVSSFGSGLVYTLIPLSIAWLLRGTASSIVVSIGLFFLPWMLAPLLPAWVQQNVLRYLPDSAKDSLAGLKGTDALTYVGQTPAIIVVAVWLAGALVAAAVVLNRRDA